MKCLMKIAIFLTVILLIFSICLFYLCYYSRNNLIYAILYGLLGLILFLCPCVYALYRFCRRTSSNVYEQIIENSSISSRMENEENTDQSFNRVNSSNSNPRKEGSVSQSRWGAKTRGWVLRHYLAPKVNTGNKGSNDSSESYSPPGSADSSQFKFDEELRGGNLRGASNVNTSNMGSKDPSKIVSSPGREQDCQLQFEEGNTDQSLHCVNSSNTNPRKEGSDSQSHQRDNLASKVNMGNVGSNDPSKIVSTPGREQDSQLPFEEENTDQSLHCVNASNSNRCKEGSDSQSHQRDKNLEYNVNMGNKGSNEPPTIVSKSGRKEDDDLQFRMSSFEDSNSSNSDPRKDGSDSQSHQKR